MSRSKRQKPAEWVYLRFARQGFRTFIYKGWKKEAGKRDGRWWFDRRMKKNTDLIKVKYALAAMWVIILDLCFNPLPRLVFSVVPPSPPPHPPFLLLFFTPSLPNFTLIQRSTITTILLLLPLLLLAQHHVCDSFAFLDLRADRQFILKAFSRRYIRKII